ncbi:MAG: hypothetical protein FJY55_10180, partial [Betaproteobacteria bacterium]|nr:hypothetical protein [Betaproteobacteria bacterium]
MARRYDDYGYSVDQLSPDLAAEAAGVRRRRRLAEALLEQSSAPIRGRMIGRVYVPASPLEGLANIGQAFAATKLSERADEQMAGIGRKSREEVVKEMARVRGIGEGMPGQVPEPASGPQDDTVPSVGGVKGDPRRAIEEAIMSQSPMVRDYGKLLEQRAAQKEMLAEQRLGRLQDRTMTLEAQAEQKGLDRESRERTEKRLDETRKEIAVIMADSRRDAASIAAGRANSKQQEIADLMASGMSREDAQGIAYGTRRVVTDPVTGAPRMVDIRTGQE